MRQIQEADMRKTETAQAIPKTYGFEAATQRRPEEKKCDLKKQSQFAPTLMGVTSFVKDDYVNIPASGVRKNKAKQSQSHTLEPPKRAGKREKSLGAANC